MMLPSISIIIPTLNSERTLKVCLSAINIQSYPKEKLEILIADGGSQDKTLEIIRNSRSKIPMKILKNHLKTAEAGKAIALRQAQGEFVALIDSDNILPDKDWLRRMIEPFNDPEIIGSEPWEFTYRESDGFIDRYCALLGMNDPLCLFMGNYDKRSILTARWTDLPVRQEDMGSWIKVTLENESIPTIGANGTILRKDVLERSGLVGEYLVDVDIIASLAAKKTIRFAKVKTGIVHLYSDSSVGTFIKKQKRRITDYLYFQKTHQRSYPWQKQSKRGLLNFILSCVIILPLLYQSLKGFSKKKDPAWFFHPLACWITLGVYASGEVLSLIGIKQVDRREWRQ